MKIEISSQSLTMQMKFYNQPSHVRKAIAAKESKEGKEFGIQFQQGVNKNKEDDTPLTFPPPNIELSPSDNADNENLPSTETFNDNSYKDLVMNYNPDTAELIHFVNCLNNRELGKTSKTGHLLIGHSMAIAELINQRPQQGDSACMNKLEGLPEGESAIIEFFKQQFENANQYLKKEHEEKAHTSGTTLERVVIDTRYKDDGKIRVFTVKAGDGDIFLVSKKDKGNLRVRQADWRDQPNATMEKERIIAAGGSNKLLEEYGIARIEGLSVSAGLGDFEKNYIRRTPRIRCFEYKVNQQNQYDLKAIIVNCDGITEKQSIAETKKLIASLMNSKEKMERQPQEIAEELAFKALKFSKDNLSAGVIMIAPLLEQDPGVYELIICDGHGEGETLISHAVCEYHTNNSFPFEII